MSQHAIVLSAIDTANTMEKDDDEPPSRSVDDFGSYFAWATFKAGLSPTLLYVGKMFAQSTSKADETGWIYSPHQRKKVEFNIRIDPPLALKHPALLYVPPPPQLAEIPVRTEIKCDYSVVL